MLRELRRKDRQMDEARAWEVLAEAEYAVLSLISPDGDPYAIPINFVLIGKSLWAHCAKEGHKLDAIAANPRACVTATLHPHVDNANTTTYYECVVALGDASVIDDEAQTRPALEAFMDKFASGWREREPDRIIRDAHTVYMLRVDVMQISGKARRPGS